MFAITVIHGIMLRMVVWSWVGLLRYQSPARGGVGFWEWSSDKIKPTAFRIKSPVNIHYLFCPVASVGRATFDIPAPGYIPPTRSYNVDLSGFVRPGFRFYS